MLLHRAFVVWRAIARFQRHQAQQKAVALAFRRLILLWKSESVLCRTVLAALLGLTASGVYLYE